MKNTALTGRAVLMFCFIMVSAATFAHTMDPSTNDYRNDKLKMQLQLPDDWQSKVKIEETDNTIVFKYNNPGGEPVYLMSITKMGEHQWADVHDQLTGAKILCHKDGMVIYAEKTNKARIKGANNQEYTAIVSQLDEVLKTFKEQ